MDSKIKLLPTKIEGVYIGQINSFKDKRGEFVRLFDYKELNKILDKPVIEVNLSKNIKKGTIRGMHYEKTNTPTMKILKCIRGSFVDKVIDLRKSSKTFLKSLTFEFVYDDNKLLLISNKIAHGFQTKEDNTEILYMHSNAYNPKIEGVLNPLDPLLNLKWPLEITSISDRDKNSANLMTDFNGF